MLKKIYILIILALSITTTATSCKKKEERYEAQFLVLFNSATKLVGYAKTEEEFSQFSRFIYDDVEEYHKLYDKYHSYDNINNIKTINDNAGKEPVKVDKRIIDLLLFSKEVYEETSGKVNIAMGSVLEIWHDYREAGIQDPINSQLPPMDELEEASKHTNIHDLIINEEDSTVYLQDENMSLDVGAIAKGYAAEQVVQNAIKHGYTDFVLSLGGNVRTVGKKGPEQELWDIGIQNPDKKSEKVSLYTLSISDLSLVASGDYERYYTVDGKRYHHIINPQTLMPAEYFTALSIACKDSAMADALSTALFNMSYEEGLSYVETLEDTHVLWIFPDGTMKHTKDFMKLVKK